MKKTILVILADGFEEVEALGTVDFLRRLELDVITAGLKSEIVYGSHGISVMSDILLEEVDEVPYVLILPGGLPGSTNLADNQKVNDLVKLTYETGNLVAAICAAPIALLKSNIVKGKKITSHPSVKEKFIESEYTGNRVEQDGNIITAKAAGVSFEFAAKIAEYLGKKIESEELLDAMYIIR